ncbi:hypothetical protein Bhz59_00009 [Stenotrophomonas phage vB_SmaS_Bhz59]
MSALIQTIFILVGALAGKTVKLGKFQFTDGQLTVNATPEETALLARALERNWQAYPKGHPALKSTKQEPSDDGKRDLPPGPTGSDGDADVQGGVQPEGAGPEAGGEAGEGGGHAGPEAGEAAELAQGDGQPAGVSEAAADAKKDDEPKAEVNVKLQKAIKKLDPKDDTHWTAAGLPAMSAVEGFYGAADITRADVEAAAPGYTRAVASK